MKMMTGIKAAVVGAGVGALGYVVGGVAAPYVAGVSPGAYAAIGFLLAAAAVAMEELK